ncbi:MAG: DUF7009 family protein [Terracidiphilus sp.]
MKLRIKGNSLRLRVSPADMARLFENGRIEETVRFAPRDDAKLTYALEHAATEKEISVRYRAQEVTVLLSTESARKWADGEQVGVYGTFDVGQGQLALAVEKDFACLDRDEANNQDAFPNPKGSVKC